MLLRALFLAGLLGLAACGRNTPHSQESYVFGTRVEVQVWGGDAARAREATAAVLREFDRMHRAYHAWQPSELTALNDAIAAGKPQNVSEELAALIVEAQAAARQSDYLFDPGIGALVKLWGFHDENFVARLPDAAKLAALKKARPSIAALKVAGACPPPGRLNAGVAIEPESSGGERPFPRTALHSRPTASAPSDASRNPALAPHPGRGMGEGCRVTSADFRVALDFGGYLKGVALDRAAAIMKAHGIGDALINIGGNVLALGTKGGTPWRVGIQHPRASASGGSPLATLDLRDGEAIGTSGDYQRYFELDGRRYNHVIDPRSGEPAIGTQSVTVLIRPHAERGSGTWSDIASKPLFVAGEDWQRLARMLDIDQVLRIDASGRIEMTDAMRQRLKMEVVPPPVQ